VLLCAEYEAILGIYRANVDHAETRGSCLVALGRTRVPELVSRALDWMVCSGEVRGQDMFSLFASLAANRRYAPGCIITMDRTSIS